MHSPGKTLLAFALLHSVFQAKFACYSWCFLTAYFCIPVPYDEKDICLGVLVLEGLVGLHRTIQLQLHQHYCLGIDLDYCDIEWFTCIAWWILNHWTTRDVLIFFSKRSLGLNYTINMS